MEQVGLIGAGLLGSALAERFLAAGFGVVGFDIDAARRDGLKAAGGDVAESAVAVAAACGRVVLSLPDSGVVAKVLEEIEPHLRPDSLVIDTTTGEPEEMAGFAARLGRRGVAYLDATVGGSSKQVRAGDAIVIAGGPPETFARAGDLFSCFARRAFHAGPCGHGARMKLALNLVLGLNRAVLAEGLAFAKACGLKPELALEIMKAGPAYSRVMDTKGAKMLSGEFSAEARLSQHLKDVRLILAAGERCGARLPLSALHRRLLERVEEAGFGGADNSAIIKAFEQT
ncbi:MAG: NAD(P)-dependent oxidoreductase [Acidobacteriota bacterium]